MNNVAISTEVEQILLEKNFVSFATLMKDPNQLFFQSNLNYEIIIKTRKT